MGIYIGAREPVGRGSRKALGLGTECSPRGGAPAPAGDVVANRGRERCEGASDEIKVVQGEHGEGTGLFGVLGFGLELRAWSFAGGEGRRVQFTGADLFEIVQA